MKATSHESTLYVPANAVIQITRTRRSTTIKATWVRRPLTSAQRKRMIEAAAERERGR